MSVRSADRWAATIGVALVVLAMLALPRAASADLPTFTEFCLEGSEAGECLGPRGVATSPVDGHIFVVDRFNFRVSEFTAWGEFIKSWGWGVEDGTAELQTCTTDSGCQEGLEGTGVGQFESPLGIAVDSAGDVYVSDRLASRVQKFSPEGEFLLMFGGGVNQGPNNPGDLCTAAHISGGDTCGAGTPGTGDGEFSSSWAISNTIATGPEDQVYVGDLERIQEFDSGGSFVRVLPDPENILDGKNVGSLAVDPVSEDVYVAQPNERGGTAAPDVFRIDETTGALLDTLLVDRPSALATNTLGDLFVFDQLDIVGTPEGPESHGTRILRFDPAGNLAETIGEAATTAEEIRRSMGLATGSACFSPAGAFGLYVANFELGSVDPYVRSYGPTPDPAKCAPPDVPPDLNDEFAAAVDTDSADLRAKINPHYFTEEVGTTTYRVQWGTAQCIEDEGFEGGCATEQPPPPGAVLDVPPADAAATTDPILLEGLAPETTYAYRFVVEREREAGSDPAVWIVIGAGDEFTTLPEETGPTGTCGNQAFRSGPGALLRDCRAYELVSPLDKDGGDVDNPLNLIPLEARMDQAAVSGDAIAFSASRAFANPKSGPFTSQYLTTRDPEEGWQTEAISPPQEGEGFLNPLIPIDNLYRAFTEDLSKAFLFTDTEPVLGTGGLPKQPNIYRRDNATDTYAACTTTVPLLSQENTQAPQLQGFSADGALAVFRIENKLTDDASSKVRGGGNPIYQVYACSYDGEVATVRLLSALPDGSASELENTTGGPANEVFPITQGRNESLDNAVSADGSKVYWTATSTTEAEGPGALYLRLNPGAPPTASGACEVSEPTNACTILVSAGPARFWKAAADGSVAIFSEGGELFEYLVATGETLPIAEEVAGLLGASEDVSRIYFLSEADLDGAAVDGEPNLYLYDKGAGTTSFIATLSELDATVGKTVPSPGNYEPAWHSARVTPDGSATAFMSNDPELAEEVAGYDNTDQATGLPAAEIYRYAIGGELVCVSCNRTGVRPSGREVQNKTLAVTPTLPAASMLPTWLNALYAPRVLSDDGSRIFFEAFEPLSAQDTNTKADVYQWEAEGTGNCSEDDSAYDPQSEGCVSLITSGQSPNDSWFVDASLSGDDVFIRTAAPLVSWDPGSIDIYDARVNGGLKAPPLPPNPEDECEGEPCKPPLTPPPPAPVPGSGAVTEGNPPAAKPKPKKCRKGTHKVKRKGKVRCVKNKKSRAGNDRRAGR
ncbi:MAG TPA: NHL repeat-containing protein [Solirubrobacterales bacterium]